MHTKEFLIGSHLSIGSITVQKNAERQVEVQSRLKEKKQLVSD